MEYFSLVRHCNFTHCLICIKTLLYEMIVIKHRLKGSHACPLVRAGRPMQAGGREGPCRCAPLGRPTRRGRPLSDQGVSAPGAAWTCRVPPRKGDSLPLPPGIVKCTTEPSQAFRVAHCVLFGPRVSWRLLVVCQAPAPRTYGETTAQNLSPCLPWECGRGRAMGQCSL